MKLRVSLEILGDLTLVADLYWAAENTVRLRVNFEILALGIKCRPVGHDFAPVSNSNFHDFG